MAVGLHVGGRQGVEVTIMRWNALNFWWLGFFPSVGQTFMPRNVVIPKARRSNDRPSQSSQSSYKVWHIDHRGKRSRWPHRLHVLWFLEDPNRSKRPHGMHLCILWQLWPLLVGPIRHCLHFTCYFDVPYHGHWHIMNRVIQCSTVHVYL